jgi:hypothetical protein
MWWVRSRLPILEDEFQITMEDTHLKRNKFANQQTEVHDTCNIQKKIIDMVKRCRKSILRTRIFLRNECKYSKYTGCLKLRMRKRPQIFNVACDRVQSKKRSKNCKRDNKTP